MAGKGENITPDFILHPCEIGCKIRIRLSCILVTDWCNLTPRLGCSKILLIHDEMLIFYFTGF